MKIILIIMLIVGTTQLLYSFEYDPSYYIINPTYGNVTITVVIYEDLIDLFKDSTLPTSYSHYDIEINKDIEDKLTNKLKIEQVDNVFTIIVPPRSLAFIGHYSSPFNKSIKEFKITSNNYNINYEITNKKNGLLDLYKIFKLDYIDLGFLKQDRFLAYYFLEI
ncbi:MAG: hypothetical protein OCD02_13165 [Spirochaetaceae bacterium]